MENERPGGDEPRPEPDGEAEPGHTPDAAARGDADDHDGGPHTALPPKLESWRRRSAAGAILTGFALGLQEALEKHKDEPSIVMETSGDPPKDLPVEAEFEYGRPRHSTVQIRPWLLSPQEPEQESPPRHPGADEDQG